MTTCCLLCIVACRRCLRACCGVMAVGVCCCLLIDVCRVLVFVVVLFRWSLVCSFVRCVLRVVCCLFFVVVCCVLVVVIVGVVCCVSCVIACCCL